MKRWKSLAGKALAVILSCVLVFSEGSMFAYAQSEKLIAEETVVVELPEEEDAVEEIKETEDVSYDAAKQNDFMESEAAAADGKVKKTADESEDVALDFSEVSGNAEEIPENSDNENDAFEITVSENEDSENVVSAEDSMYSDFAETENSESDTTSSNSAETENSESDTTSSNSAETENSESDTMSSNSAETENSESDTTSSDSAETEIAESDKLTSNSTENEMSKSDELLHTAENMMQVTEYQEENNILLEEISEEETMLASSAEESDNINDQNYVKWAENINSYLVYLDDGRYMRVENLSDNILVEYYSSAFQLKSSKTIARQQSLFGGFYAGKDFYYVVYGKNNAEEKDSNIVMEVVKYDTSWKEIMSEKIYGCNTKTPFSYGSLRMTEENGYLYIRTCHTMYKSSDQKNHQANWTLQLRESDMTLVDSFYSISSITEGYVSHSFNQFILADDNKNLVTLDHGDAFPRGIVLGRYGKKAGEETFTGSFENKTVFAFEGDGGNNSTGASVGGFEYSSDYYLVAGNTVERGDGWEQRSIRNIFVCTVNKSDLSDARRFYITEYEENGNISTTTPQLVKFSNDKFLLMWGLLENGKDTGKMSYVFLGSNGKATSKIYTVSGYVSDCKPIVANDYAVWYVTKNGQTVHYLISSEGAFSGSVKLGQEDSGSFGEYFESYLTAATTATIAKQYYTTQPIIPSDASVNLVVGGKRLKQGVDYDIICTDNIEIGKASALITGKGKYQGTKTISFTIAKRPLTKVKIDTIESLDNFVYDGEAKTPKLGLYIETNGEKIILQEDRDYLLTYLDNTDAGTAKAKFVGIGNFSGIKTKNYKIAKMDVTYCEDFTTSLPEEYEYIKGGLMKTLKADTEVFYKGQKLKLNKDYSLMFRNYNPSKSANGYAQGTLIIKGKKNFIGNKTVTFRIRCKDLSQIQVNVMDKVYVEKEGNYIVTPSLKDSSGKTLTKRKDFSDEFEYYADGRRLEPTEMVLPGTEITIVVKSIEGCMYTGSVSATYRVVEKDIKKAAVTCVNDVLYVTYDGIPLTEGVDYEVVSKVLNKNGRSYKLVLHGLGAYGRLKQKTVVRK